MPERLKNKDYSIPIEIEPSQEQVEGATRLKNPVVIPPTATQEPAPLFSESPAVSITPENQELRTIEGLLAEGLDDVVSGMDTPTQEAFKKQGVSTASAIQKILHSTKVQVQKIFNLILIWLRSIPKVNKFFLEQEAKIKTDKVLALPKQPNPS